MQARRDHGGFVRCRAADRRLHESGRGRQSYWQAGNAEHERDDPDWHPAVNGSRKPLNDRRIRLAFNLALNRKAIASAASNGLGRSATDDQRLDERPDVNVYQSDVGGCTKSKLNLDNWQGQYYTS